MKTKIILIVTASVTILIFIIIGYVLATQDIAVLNPQGRIAQEQYNILKIATLLSAIVVIPVYIMLFSFAWRYRSSNKKAHYAPDWDNNKKAEALWWGIPIILICILSIITWQSSHDLDPSKPIVSTKKPINVQVVSLQWKWLFIYPDYGVATVNYLQIPEQTPINFILTSDAPMNSFWVPSLGGQIYTMSGMRTSLHLEASSTGEYRGSSSNISGEGYSKMTFKVESVSSEKFNNWISDSQLSPEQLTLQSYSELARPNITNKQTIYSNTEPNLFDTILNKYMHNSHQEIKPSHNEDTTHPHNHTHPKGDQ